MRRKSRTTGALVAMLLPVFTAAASADLSTPRRALQTFVDAAALGDYTGAAIALDLRHVPEGMRSVVGPRLARELAFVLESQLWIDWDRVSDDPRGGGRGAATPEVVGSLTAGRLAVPLQLVRGADGNWRVASSVVAAIPRLYRSHGPGWVGDRLPPSLIELRFLDVEAWQWIGLALAIIAGIGLAAALDGAGFALARRAAVRRRTASSRPIGYEFRGPVRLLIATGVFALVERALDLPVPAQRNVEHVMRIATVVSFAWAALRGLRIVGDRVGSHATLAPEDADARARMTRVMVLRRIVSFVVVVVASALVLMQFDALRALGTSLLASAGLAGVVVGLASQRSLASVFAGIQMSLTQPIRVGDVVTIDGETGTVEEITLTYVVVKIWDLRRMIVPITKFLDTSFQNWTRAGTSILGGATVHADYRAPVAELRRELARFVATRPEWDGKVASLDVSGATDRTIQLTAVVSSADADRNGALRAAIREHLVGALRELDDEGYLPRTRVEIPGGDRGDLGIASSRGPPRARTDAGPTGDRRTGDAPQR